MKALIQVIALTGVVAAPAFAQEPGALLDAMTCREFLALAAPDQVTVMLALRAHVNGEPLPDEPLPVGTQAEVDGADSDPEGVAAEGTDASTDTPGNGAAETSDPTTEAADEGTTAISVGDEEVVDGENESGKVNPDGSEVAATDEPDDPKLVAMRTSCEGGPDALATDALRAAHADYE
jgi:hypothetical protein